MSDTTIQKIDSRHSPSGEQGQKYLSSGKSLSMRLWEDESPAEHKEETKRDYETIGYVLKGKAELKCEGQTVILNTGDSWVVPKGANHSYKIIETFSAVEATSPPAEVHARDQVVQGKPKVAQKLEDSQKVPASSES
jgi:quercetin dioxygenase-like cupin family protein